LENMIPYPFAFAPGAKLGLANLIMIDRPIVNGNRYF